MKKVKYLVLPGTVKSPHDGQLHYINEKDLMKLFMVDPEECVWPDRGRSAEYLLQRYPYMTVLSPVVGGEYPLFDKMDEEEKKNKPPKIRKIRGE